VLGLIADIRGADSTKGGYEHPFEGWSGKTIHFSAILLNKRWVAQKWLRR
jgi:hypothetical protein